MLRAKLFAATATAALLIAPAAFAQDVPATEPQTPPATTPTPPVQPPAQVDPAMPAAPAATATQAAPAATPAAGQSVVDVLRSSGQFSTLLSALDQAQLTETLASRPAISIFAPTDEAFAALPEAERTRLLDPANANELRQVLLYHVIVADVTPDQIEGKKGGVPTAAESQILLDGTGEMIKADDAHVVSAELDASNGAVFPIDKVLNPANSQAAMGDEESAADAAAPAEATEPADEAMPAPDAAPAPEAAPVPEAAPAPEAGVTETTEPAMPGDTAPTGEPAATTTTVASPPVPNPTDGQMDDQAAPAAHPATNPSETPPVQTPDPADGEQEGDVTPQ